MRFEVLKIVYSKLQMRFRNGIIQKGGKDTPNVGMDIARAKSGK